jgi:ribose transport system ATP-binding protein
MLVFENINKAYGATQALKAVNLNAAPGTVLGLVGENGAGKSTLIKIVSGASSADSGDMLLDGKLITPRDTKHAMTLGISSVFQELSLVRELTVEQNLLLNSAPRTYWGSIDRNQLRQRTIKILIHYQLNVDPAARVGTLPLGQQQMIEIIRAVERKPRVLLLDEATSALGASEVEWLAKLINRLQQDNTIILFISHRWDEVIRFCNQVAILRNGELIKTAKTSALSENEAVQLMTGRESVSESFPAKHVTKGDVVLSARNLCTRTLRGIDFDLKAGEILGLGGLVGQGQGSLLESLFGAEDLSSGNVVVSNKPYNRPTPRSAIKAGIALVPQERKTEGLLLDKNVTVNMTLAILGRIETFLGIINFKREADLVQESIAHVQIKAPSGATPVNQLSGGNQQKVLLEKWLKIGPKILLLNDVTRGVDVATKRQIYATVTKIAASGVGVIWYSTDARELVGVVHRVLVLLHGRINAELHDEDLSVERIIRASVIQNNVGASRSYDIPAN